jgi:hypothetical protein
MQFYIAPLTKSTAPVKIPCPTSAFSAISSSTPQQAHLLSAAKSRSVFFHEKIGISYERSGHKKSFFVAVDGGMQCIFFCELSALLLSPGPINIE